MIFEIELPRMIQRKCKQRREMEALSFVRSVENYQIKCVNVLINNGKLENKRSNMQLRLPKKSKEATSGEMQLVEYK